MAGFEPQTTGVKNDHSTNWATTTAPNVHCLYYQLTVSRPTYLTNALWVGQMIQAL